jgi:uncharacterized membrane protein YukC
MENVNETVKDSIEEELDQAGKAFDQLEEESMVERAKLKCKKFCDHKYTKIGVGVAGVLALIGVGYLLTRENPTELIIIDATQD